MFRVSLPCIWLVSFQASVCIFFLALKLALFLCLAPPSFLKRTPGTGNVWSFSKVGEVFLWKEDPGFSVSISLANLVQFALQWCLKNTNRRFKTAELRSFKEQNQKSWYFCNVSVKHYQVILFTNPYEHWNLILTLNSWIIEWFNVRIFEKVKL